MQMIQWCDTAGQVVARGTWHGTSCTIDVPGIALFAFSSNNSDEPLTTNLKTSPDAIEAAYRRIVVPLMLQVRGSEVLHASAVLFPQGIVVLCGLSRSGKSTIAYALSRHAGDLWADDSLVWLPGATGPVAQSLPFSLQLRPESARYFLHTQSAQDQQPNGKHSQNISPTHSAPQRIAAICVLGQQSEPLDPPATINRLTPATAFTAVLAHAHYFTINNAPRSRLMINNYLGLVRDVPVFNVTYSRSLNNLPGVLQAIRTTVENL